MPSLSEWLAEKPLAERYEEFFTIKIHEKHRMYYVIAVNVINTFVCLLLTGIVEDDLGSAAKGMRWAICFLGFAFAGAGVYSVYKEESTAAFIYFVSTAAIGFFFFIAFCLDADQLTDYRDQCSSCVESSWEAMVAFDFFALFFMPFVCSYAWFFFKELEHQEMFVDAQKRGTVGSNGVVRINMDEEEGDEERGDAGFDDEEEEEEEEDAENEENEDEENEDEPQEDGENQDEDGDGGDNEAGEDGDAEEQEDQPAQHDAEDAPADDNASANEDAPAGEDAPAEDEPQPDAPARDPNDQSRGPSMF